MSIPFEVIELDKSRRLRFGTAAFREIEQRLNKTIFQLNYSRLGFTELSVLLYAGLKWEDDNLTMGRIDEIIDDHIDDLALIQDKIADAILNAFPSMKGKESKNVKAPAAAR